MAHLRESTQARRQRHAGDRLRPAVLSESQRKTNLRTAWILAGLAALFGVGFFLRIVVFGG
jgi:hypothetical protein